ncbi:3-methyl-2-oxobutanoate dehydrogenase subunit VorB [Candidatus Darwinibacter acetoxidans]|nr:3-methyl-2-oxobutanoate dehydrogenase subunit VorB [Limnochordia bacterium]NLO95226.1 3-methyl-2-oxobutanoate dehydrogenase subunit VorB [Bacillota bacterium]HOQ73756.1 3-methyl-2-oxobutanoate dehydrogenase subunit VorB [Limnochordia bacterium]HPU64841.1 3-methyl-2-oxobutanoate dehydrogenase subunit VorB [Limnochordia bacterium]HPZ79322.1 3-methyl-2-oxobutanoate dehydrogenase subunit VorB [Limnochordia bacterium]
MAKILMKGNEALAEAAIRAGCKAFFGYPITPQNEVPGYMADQLPLRGGVYLQAESEVAAINMVYGAAGAGARVMTSSSSPGISLKQEGISYIAAAELPCVIANVVRCGPGLGGIQPSQGDYFQAVKGGGHGDYRLIVLAPGSVQEMAELTTLAFDLADKWRNPVMILSDGILGQMMEPVEFPEDYQPLEVEKPWATTGAKGRERNIVNTLDIIPESLEKKVEKLLEKYERIKREEVRWKEEGTEDAEIILVGYGTSARIARSAMEQARQKGLKVGLFRPITLFPFPEERLRALAGPGRQFLAVEMSAGQMIEDVRLAVEGRSPVHLCRRLGGMVPTPEDVLAKIQELVEGRAS